MNDDPTLLASAYLDDEVTPDERARVEGDPVLLAEVDRLRAVRVLLADVEPAAISVREAQLATALDIWERLPLAERTGARRDVTPSGIDAAAVAGAASVTAPTPLKRRRSTSTRWLTSAAAALVLVLAGGVALQLATDDDGDTTSAELAGDAEALAAEDTAGATDVRAADELSAAAEATDDAAGAADAELDTGVDDPAPPPETGGLDQLQNLTDLADFAAAAVGAPVAPDVPAATSAASDEELSEAETFLAETGLPVCLGVDVVVGPAVYGDVPVVVGIDEGRNLAIAYRPATCAEVARVRLP